MSTKTIDSLIKCKVVYVKQASLQQLTALKKAGFTIIYR